MNRVEVLTIEEIEDIEETVNTYCNRYELTPISISVAYSQKTDCWCVCLVVEWVSDNV